MVENKRNVDTIFLAAIEIGSDHDRQAYLEQACGGDAQARSEVEGLLRVHFTPGSFVGQLGAALDKTVDSPGVVEDLGTLIGPYKLLEQIGAGGMGVVYMADQQAPVRRRVALKIIKPGMDTREVIARFEAERQALALMDHPNIARVLDAGATNSGLPFFVMELVRGIPITQYCDQNNLDVAERLALFMRVCQAVQHAHQKGIIHRDLKPSNVLVTLHDGQPVPKVIDFGLAKATNQQLTDKTLFTKFAQMVGTPLYMSPEQAEMSGLDVDTRTDIYSLGVLLYELLTGTTPYDRQRLYEAGYDEIRRIIREEEPPRPSTRISTLGETRTAIAAHRKVDHSRLQQLIRGDLDWIVMKALEKDRTRRYETAGDLGRDIERYLSDQPVEACPPSTAYRFRKFARRNRVALTTGVLVSAVLVLGTVVSTWQAVRATLAERAADAARSDEAEQRKLAEAQRIEAEQERTKAEQQQERADQKAEEAIASAKIASDARLKATDEAEKATRVAQFLAGMFEASAPQKHMGFRFTGLGIRGPKNMPDPTYLAARELLDKGAQKVVGELKDQPAVQAALMDTIGNVYIALGLTEQAESLLETALDIRRRLHSESHLDTAASFQSLAILRSMQSRPTETINASREALTIRQDLLAADHRDIIDTKFTLAVALALNGNGTGEAEDLLREVLSWRRDHFGKEHPETAYAMIMLAGTLALKHTTEEAAPLLKEAAAALAKDPVAKPLGLALSEVFQAMLLAQLGQSQKAVASSTKAIEHFREFEADEHPLFLAVAMLHAGILISADQLGAAKQFCHEQIQRLQDRGRTLNPSWVPDLAAVLLRGNDPKDLEEAEKLCRQSLEKIREPGKPPTSTDFYLVGALVKVLAEKAWRAGDPKDLDEAEKLYREAASISKELGIRPTAEHIALLKSIAEPLQLRDPPRAEALYREAIEIMKESLSRERELKEGNKLDVSPFAQVVGAFGLLLRSGGKTDEAEALYREFLPRTLEHIDQFYTMWLTQEMADLKQEQKHFAEAERLYNETLKLAEPIRRKNPKLGRTWISGGLCRLGECLAAQGKNAEAEQTYGKAIAVGDTYWTSIAKAELADLLRRRSATDEGLALLRNAIALGKDESYTDWVRKWRNLNDLMKKRGSDKAAFAAVFEEAELVLAEARKRLGDEPAEIATILVNVGDTFSDQGEFQRAEPLLREGIEIRRKVLLPDSWRNGSAQVVLAECLLGMTRYDEAEPILLSAHSSLSSTRGLHDAWTVRAAKQIIRLYDAWQKPEKAEEYRKLFSNQAAAKP